MPPTVKYPDLQPKSPARVLTSEECRKIMNEKHAKKMKDLKEGIKETRKRKKERRKGKADTSTKIEKL